MMVELFGGRNKEYCLRPDEGNINKLCERDERLKVEISNGKLLIDIGLDTLAWAAEHSPDFEDEYYKSMLKISNIDGFAKDVVRELESEQEDGTTSVHLLLDKAFKGAVDNGSEHCTFQGE